MYSMFKEILATYLFTKLLGKERARKLSIALQKYTIKTASIVFGLISIIQSIRFAFGFEISVAGFAVPVWVSLIVAIIAGYLSFGLWKLK